MPIILDGAGLARRRLPRLSARARAYAERHGTPPSLLILAFAAGPDGAAPHIRRKLDACAEAGIIGTAVVLPATATTADTVAALDDATALQRYDGIFLQFPFPAGVDAARLCEAVPWPADVDVMTARRVAEYMQDPAAPPPVTVAAGLALLDAYDVPTSGVTAAIVAEDSDFARMFSLAVARRGAVARPLVAPGPGIAAALAGAELVVVAAAVPHVVRTDWLDDGAAVIDVGYYNPGGRGDVDTAPGVRHLAALAPVPGGIGPMTVSCLLERVIDFAERRDPAN